jgi:hypothetical protein
MLASSGSILRAPCIRSTDHAFFCAVSDMASVHACAFAHLDLMTKNDGLLISVQSTILIEVLVRIVREERRNRGLCQISSPGDSHLIVDDLTGRVPCDLLSGDGYSDELAQAAL